MIYDKIKKDMVQAMKDHNKSLQSLLKVLVSDINRDPNKDYSDVKAIKVIKQTSGMLYSNYDALGISQDLIDAEYLERVYLPAQISDEAIITFLDTLDFSKFKNKMQAISKVKANFPDGSIDGEVVKNIVLKYEC